jgi:hypothetical protein
MCYNSAMSIVYPKATEMIKGSRNGASFCPLDHNDFNLYNIPSREIIDLKQDGSDLLPTKNESEVFLLELVRTIDDKQITRIYQINDDKGLNYLIGQCNNPNARHYLCEATLYRVRLVEQ